MSKSKKRYKNSNYKGIKSTPVKQQDEKKEYLSLASTIISSIIAILPVFLAVLGAFFNISDKPSINFKYAISLIIILLSIITCFLFHCGCPKPTTMKDKRVHFVVNLLLGLSVLLGVFLFLASSHLNRENQNSSLPTIENEISQSSAIQPIENERNQNSTSQTITNDERTLLMQAELYYNGGKYESVIERYSSETLQKNPIVLNNLGYMYSKGIYFEQNFDEAIHYYELASQNGLDTALHNLVSLRLHNCKTFEEVVDVLRFGYDSNEKGTVLFLGSILEGRDLSEVEMTSQEQDLVIANIESFFGSDSETQANILSVSLRTERRSTKVSMKYPLSNQLYENFISLGTTTEYYGRGYITLYNYLKYNRAFLYDNLMQESFVSVVSSE